MSVFCRLAHNASIVADGSKLEIYGESMMGFEEQASYEMTFEYGPVVDMVNLGEGLVHILTERMVLLLESHEPHTESFMIKRSWPR